MQSIYGDSDKRFPSKVGISFNREQWKKFKGVVFRTNSHLLQKITQDLQEEIVDNFFLTHSVQFSNVGIRRWYIDQGKLRAGKPGINFSVKQWNDLVNAFSKIDKELMKIEQCD